MQGEGKQGDIYAHPYARKRRENGRKRERERASARGTLVLAQQLANSSGRSPCFFFYGLSSSCFVAHAASVEADGGVRC